MQEPWKVLFGSAVGTSHEVRGESCQDYANARLLMIDGSPVLIAACADGAGTASRAAIGARLACLGFLHAARRHLEGGLPIPDITDRHILHWYEEARRRLSLEACLSATELRDFACTLLTAVVGDQNAVFSQIGDGAIVFPDAVGYQIAFWPQRGEYANTTFFITGQDFAEQLAVRTVNQRISELALITDGLQPLALHYASQSAHAPFFVPILQSLRNAEDAEELEIPFHEFLRCQRVNDQTDDDKTLILATRRSPDNGSA